MNLTNLYYSFRPLIPRLCQIYIRRSFVRHIRHRANNLWPILESAATPPPHWHGWPEGKAFAFVLTHDVERAGGHDKCREIMALEEKLGFRSSFNFVPERYKVSAALREEMTERGFEVGIHGLRHDGLLFKSRRVFERRAPRINHYLAEWHAVGFRSPSMRRDLDWIGELKIEYDASTFDTDPFEPNPVGVATIFPFLYGTNRAVTPYVELPYTLPQDFTLFVLMNEPTPAIWIKKLDWLVAKGGMALLNTHPDYTCLTHGKPPTGEYPVEVYETFLQYVRTEYRDRYWHALPRDVATLWRNTYLSGKDASETSHGVDTITPKTERAKRIWIDLDNTPHVPFFRPIIAALEQRGYDVLVTARDAFQVCDLANHMRVPYMKVGRHYGKNKLAKVTGLFYRAMQLFPIVAHRRPDLALSHGSRSQLILSNVLGIPSILIEDYEYAKFPPLMRASWRMTPDVIPANATVSDGHGILNYPGIKEDVYAADFIPDPGLYDQLGLSDQDIIATVRPPATEAHYHNPESEILLAAAMEKLCTAENVRVVLLPRNNKQAAALKKMWPQWFDQGKILIPEHAIDGLNLLWFSDLVISGGGTMNREAAALRVPVYSIFRGPIGAVDKHLSRTGRLVLLESVEDVRQKLTLSHRTRQVGERHLRNDALDAIVRHIVFVLERQDSDKK